MTRHLARGLLVLAALSVSGCAAFSPDSGMSTVSELTSQTINKDVAFMRTTEGAGAVDARVRQLLARTLSAESAVQTALLNNKGLQAAYNELALAETDLVEQSLPPNPVFSISRISGNGTTRPPGSRSNAASRSALCCAMSARRTTNSCSPRPRRISRMPWR